MSTSGSLKNVYLYCLLLRSRPVTVWRRAIRSRKRGARMCLALAHLCKSNNLQLLTMPVATWVWRNPAAEVWSGPNLRRMGQEKRLFPRDDRLAARPVTCPEPGSGSGDFEEVAGTRAGARELPGRQLHDREGAQSARDPTRRHRL